MWPRKGLVLSSFLPSNFLRFTTLWFHFNHDVSAEGKPDHAASPLDPSIAHAFEWHYFLRFFFALGFVLPISSSCFFFIRLLMCFPCSAILSPFPLRFRPTTVKEPVSRLVSARVGHITHFR